MGEQHHVTGHGKGHEAKKEQRVQKEVSKTTAAGWIWFLAIFIMMSSCQAVSFAVEIQKTSVGFLLGTSLSRNQGKKESPRCCYRNSSTGQGRFVELVGNPESLGKPTTKLNRDMMREVAQIERACRP